MRRSHAFVLALAVVGIALDAQAAPPAGQSAFLSGMHDMESASWIKSTPATPTCDRGWITDLQYIGFGGTPSASCHAAETAAGISVIQRLDASGSEPFPHDPTKADGYASAFASFVSVCPNLHVWIVGNEPNVGWSEDVELTSTANAAAYAAVHKKVHAVAGHASDLVLLAPDSPYSPVCICSLHKAIQKVKAKGVTPDGYAVHAYTQAQVATDLPGMTSLVTSEAMSGSADGCGYPFHWQFRIYRDWIKAIEAEGEGGHPVFVTESGNACKPAAGNKCYPDSDLGYFQALFGELDAWNASATTKVRAITPYRWTLNDDGTGRDFAIGNRPTLLVDLKKAFEKKYAWTTPATCGTPVETCTDDAGCAGAKICDLPTSKCIDTTPCGPGGTCASGSICRSPTNDCVPISRGEGKLEAKTQPFKPGDTATLDASSTTGYTNVAMELAGPSGAIVTKWKGLEKPDYHWVWTAPLAATGTHRATFRADPGGKVYAIGYFNVGDIVFPDAGPSDAGSDASGSDASVLPDGGGSDSSQREGEDLQGSCGCRHASRGKAESWWLILGLAVTLARRRRAPLP